MFYKQVYSGTVFWSRLQILWVPVRARPLWLIGELIMVDFASSFCSRLTMRSSSSSRIVCVCPVDIFSVVICNRGGGVFGGDDFGSSSSSSNSPSDIGGLCARSCIGHSSYVVIVVKARRLFVPAVATEHII